MFGSMKKGVIFAKQSQTKNKSHEHSSKLYRIRANGYQCNC